MSGPAPSRARDPRFPAGAPRARANRQRALAVGLALAPALLWNGCARLSASNAQDAETGAPDSLHDATRPPSDQGAESTYLGDDAISLDAAKDADANSHPWTRVGTIYRSVGSQSSAPLAVGDADGQRNTCTISRDIATFANPLPDRVGVGDIMVYDLDSDGVYDNDDGTAFVQRRRSARELELVSGHGDPPPPVVAEKRWAIYRAYTSLANAESGLENEAIPAALRDFESWNGGHDLTASRQSWHIACYADAPDRTTVTISGWTTSESHRLRIFSPMLPHEVGVRQRHDGTATTGYVLHPTASAHAIDIRTPHVTLEGLEITGWKNTSSHNSHEAVSVAASDVLLDSLLIHDDEAVDTTNPNGDGINLDLVPQGGAVTIRNSMIYGISRAGILVSSDTNAFTLRVENCTLFRTGLSGADADGRAGVAVESDLVSLTVLNTISTGAQTAGDFTLDRAALSAESTHNISSDATAPGGLTALTMQQPQSLFRSVLVGSEDLHLRSGSNAANAAVDLTSHFSSDIDGDTRGGVWDVGADEI